MEKKLTNKIDHPALSIEFCQQMIAGADAWYLECIKHLVVLNGIGMTVIGAIYTSDMISIKLHIGGHGSMGGFIIGLLTAMLSMGITSVDKKNLAIALINEFTSNAYPHPDSFFQFKKWLMRLRRTEWLVFISACGFSYGAFPFLRAAL